MSFLKYTLALSSATVVITLLAVPQHAAAQGAPSYSISTHSMDSGAGVATGGTFSLTGIIGQPDAGSPLTGGTYTLTGGFFYPMANDSHVRGWALY